ncbi:short-chain dehydrogenase/reductase SDR [Terfezia claveryi]|nr:short-chain dehydrogenase/reductase SDR [Terfezia claveryi]
MSSDSASTQTASPPAGSSSPPALPPQLLLHKTAIITGASTGIGRAIALEYARHGCHICINYYDPYPATSSQQPSLISTLRSEISSLPQPPGHMVKFVAIEGDISLPQTATMLVSEAVKAFGHVDIFVSNAGICQFHEFLSLPPELLTSTINTNLTGAFLATQAAANQMARQGHGGSIIGISSISALVGGGGQTHYTPTKAGVLSLMQSCAVALGKYGIRCNAILPGTVRTRLNDGDLEDEGKRAYMEGRVPLGRLGVPRDVAGRRGAQLLVDGGLFVNLQ